MPSTTSITPTKVGLTNRTCTLAEAPTGVMLVRLNALPLGSCLFMKTKKQPREVRAYYIRIDGDKPTYFDLVPFGTEKVRVTTSRRPKVFDLT